MLDGKNLLRQSRLDANCAVVFRIADNIQGDVVYVTTGAGAQKIVRRMSSLFSNLCFLRCRRLVCDSIGKGRWVESHCFGRL